MLVSPAPNTLWPAINAKFGLAQDAPPEATAAAIKADPDAKAKLQAVADEHDDLIAQAMARDQLDEKETEDARATEVALVQAKSPVQRGAPVVSVVATLGFVAAAGVLWHPGEVSSAGNQIIGAMIVVWTTVLNSWCGASKGGSDRADQMATMLHQAINGGVPTSNTAKRAQR